jgi:hypothetical protein
VTCKPEIISAFARSLKRTKKTAVEKADRRSCWLLVTSLHWLRNESGRKQFSRNIPYIEIHFFMLGDTKGSFRKKGMNFED